MNNKKQTIRLNESQLKRVVAEAVKRLLYEGKFINNRKPKGNMSYVNDKTGEVVDIPEEPFYKEYSSKSAIEKRKKRLKSQVLPDDGVLALSDGFVDDDYTIETALKRLKLHPEQLELTPVEMRTGSLQWWDNPKKMPNSKRIAANYMWELWDVNGEPLYVLRDDYIKKHKDEIFGHGKSENYVDVRNDTIDLYGV